MAEPWTDDLAALGERSRAQLRSLAATRAHVLSTQETSKMRFFKNRPLLATLLVLALVGVASGAAYAVDRVFLSVDPDKSAPEIEQDVKSQLESAGVEVTSVQAEKTDGRVEIRIASPDEHLGSALAVQGPDGVIEGVGGAGQLRLEIGCTLTDAQQKQLVDAGASKEMMDALTCEADAAARVTRIENALAAHGFHDVTVTVTADTVTVTVKAPPTP